MSRWPTEKALAHLAELRARRGEPPPKAAGPSVEEKRRELVAAALNHWRCGCPKSGAAHEHFDAACARYVEVTGGVA